MNTDCILVNCLMPDGSIGIRIKRDDISKCRVCGYDYIDYYPWGEDGHLPDFTICDCCGVEFGYEDVGILSIKQYRKKWIEEGANWFFPELMPEGWTVNEIYKSIPKPFL